MQRPSRSDAIGHARAVARIESRASGQRNGCCRRSRDAKRRPRRRKADDMPIPAAQHHDEIDGNDPGAVRERFHRRITDAAVR